MSVLARYMQLLKAREFKRGEVMRFLTTIVASLCMISSFAKVYNPEKIELDYASVNDKVFINYKVSPNFKVQEPIDTKLKEITYLQSEIYQELNRILKEAEILRLDAVAKNQLVSFDPSSLDNPNKKNKRRQKIHQKRANMIVPAILDAIENEAEKANIEKDLKQAKILRMLPYPALNKLLDATATAFDRYAHAIDKRVLKNLKLNPNELYWNKYGTLTRAISYQEKLLDLREKVYEGLNSLFEEERYLDHLKSLAGIDIIKPVGSINNISSVNISEVIKENSRFYLKRDNSSSQVITR